MIEEDRIRTLVDALEREEWSDPTLVRDTSKLLTLDESDPTYTRLREIGEPALPFLLQKIGNDSYKVRMLIQYIGKPAVPHLVKYLQNPVAVQRADAVQILGLMSARKAIPHLLPLLWDEDASVRDYTEKALRAMNAFNWWNRLRGRAIILMRRIRTLLKRVRVKLHLPDRSQP